MSKRSAKFKRRDRDFYPTPTSVVIPLAGHINADSSFVEPCAGDGALVDALEAHGFRCLAATDIHPMRKDVGFADAFALIESKADFIISNVPWTRQILHPMIDHFRKMRPTWLLFDADWMHCKQAIPYLPYCHKIVSVGRVKWIPDSTHTGKDNAAWYLFDRDPAPTEFIGRTA